jgi:hypothetical protein
MVLYKFIPKYLNTAVPTTMLRDRGWTYKVTGRDRTVSGHGCILIENTYENQGECNS